MPLDVTSPEALQRYINAHVPPDKTVFVYLGAKAGSDTPASVSAQVGVRLRKGWSLGGEFSIEKSVVGIGISSDAAPTAGLAWKVAGGGIFVF